MKKYTIYISSVWLLLSLFTIFIYYTNAINFKWIDIPTHFVAGIMLGAIFFILSKKNVQKTIILSFLVFLAWEFFEILAAASSEREFIINLFSEPKSNRIQDVIVDTLGLACFFLIYGKYRIKSKAIYVPEE